MDHLLVKSGEAIHDSFPKYFSTIPSFLGNFDDEKSLLDTCIT